MLRHWDCIDRLIYHFGFELDRTLRVLLEALMRVMAALKLQVMADSSLNDFYYYYYYGRPRWRVVRIAMCSLHARSA